MTNTGVRIVRWSPRDLRRRLDEAMQIYAAAMGYPPQLARQRAGQTAGHTRRSGFRATAALTDTGSLVGFGYGYRSMKGQWWHDQVGNAIGPALSSEWLHNSFELCELHVLPQWQGQGIGRNLLITLLSRVKERQVLLSTPEGETRARRLYRRLGFTDLARDYAFPGDNRPFAVLGARLPLAIDEDRGNR